MTKIGQTESKNALSQAKMTYAFTAVTIVLCEYNYMKLMITNFLFSFNINKYILLFIIPFS